MQTPAQWTLCNQNADLANSKIAPICIDLTRGSTRGYFHNGTAAFPFDSTHLPLPRPTPRPAGVYAGPCFIVVAGPCLPTAPHAKGGHGGCSENRYSPD